MDGPSLRRSRCGDREHLEGGVPVRMKPAWDRFLSELVGLSPPDDRPGRQYQLGCRCLKRAPFAFIARVLAT